jgi:hypothetical protein
MRFGPRKKHRARASAMAAREMAQEETVIRNRLAVFEVEKEISVYKERDYEHGERSDHRLLRLDDLLV